VFQFDAQDSPPGLVNYWGYAPVSFFAPHHGLQFHGEIPLGPVRRIRDMVKALPSRRHRSDSRCRVQSHGGRVTTPARR
jgi:glycogen operon protein